MSKLTIVVGAKTRLGAAVVSLLEAHDEPFSLLARHAEDARVLYQRHPGATVLQVGPDAHVAATDIRLLVCALGPAHPASPDLPAASASLASELVMLQQLLSRACGRVHAVLVSSAVALVPTRDRCYYGGFKNLAESGLAQVLRSCPDARLSVIYPGRLVGDDGGRIRGWLGTRYASLARTLLTTAAQSDSRHRLIGVDARMWMALRLLGLLLVSIRGRVSAPALNLRDGEPRQ